MDTHDYAILVERQSNRKFFNPYGLLDGNVGRGNSTLTRLKVWTGFSQASFEWSITGLRSSGPIITSKRFVAGGIVWALWLDMGPNSTHERQQGHDTVGVMLAASWASTWHEDESVAVSVRVALPDADWELAEFSAAVSPDVGAVLTSSTSGMWVSDLDRGLLEQGLLGASDDCLLLRVHLLNVTARWQEDGAHPEARYSRAVRQQVSAALGADSYGVRHEFDTMVRTTIVDFSTSGSGDDGDRTRCGGTEAYTRYEWGEMTYNSSVVGELLWYLVLDNLRCHGLSDQEAYGKIDAVVAMCDILVGRITSHPRVRIVTDSAESGVRYVDEQGEDLRPYGLPCKTPQGFTSCGAGAAVSAERTLIQTVRRVGTGHSGHYNARSTGIGGGSGGGGGFFWGANYDSWLTGWLAVDPRNGSWRSLGAVATTMMGLLVGGGSASGSRSSSSSNNSTQAAATAPPAMRTEAPASMTSSGTVDPRQQKEQQRHQEKTGQIVEGSKAALWRLPGGKGSGGSGGDGGSSAAGGLSGDFLRWLFRDRYTTAQQLQQQQEESQPPLSVTSSDGDDDVEMGELVAVVVSLLAFTTMLAVGIVMLINGRSPRLVIRLWMYAIRGAKRRGLRRERIRRDHAPPSLVDAVAAAAAAAGEARSPGHASGGSGAFVAAAAAAVGSSDGSRAYSYQSSAAATGAGSVVSVQLSSPQPRLRRNSSSSCGGSSSNSASSNSSGSRSSSSAGSGGSGSGSGSCLMAISLTGSNWLGLKSASASPPRPKHPVRSPPLPMPPLAPEHAGQSCNGATVCRGRGGGLLCWLSSLLLWPAQALLRPRTRGRTPKRRLDSTVLGLTTGMATEMTGEMTARFPAIKAAGGHAGRNQQSKPTGASRSHPVADNRCKHKQQQMQHPQRQLSAAVAKPLSRSEHHQALTPASPLLQPQQLVPSAPMAVALAATAIDTVMTGMAAVAAERADAVAGRPSLQQRLNGRPSPYGGLPCRASAGTAAVAVVESPSPSGSTFNGIPPPQLPYAFSSPVRADWVTTTRRCISAVLPPRGPTSTPTPTQAPIDSQHHLAATGSGCCCSCTIKPPGNRGSNLEPHSKMNRRDATEPVTSADEGAISSLGNYLGLIRSATSINLCNKWLSQKSSLTSLGSIVGSLGFASLASRLQTAAAPISSVSCGPTDTDGSRGSSSGCGCSVSCTCKHSCSCGGSDGEGGAAAAAGTPQPPPQWRPVPNLPWSLALLAKMADDSSWRCREDQPLSPPDFACLACMDAPRECGFLHSGTVHMGLCMECASRLPPAAEGALSCPVCRQPVERIVEIVF
ncbi:hypothetical protein Vretimale_6694 [Volvox reticuliferus]|uniref:RING-type domain-containing protein n=1 Tax=Volvox reticuliferus TaxID=1737510 RepID=A0A8J4G8C3_9CHLO|nr:hypothetical protein Vretimale_6694 [Volvox reticuliferus]